MDGSKQRPPVADLFIVDSKGLLMKRTLLASTFFFLVGVATLLLAASIFYACRSGGDPHHERSSSSHDTPVEEARAERIPRTKTDGMRLVLAPATSPADAPSALTSMA